MLIEGSFIEYGSGFEKDNVTQLDIEKGLSDLSIMDDEHGRFFVGVYDSGTTEMGIEITKDLVLYGNFSEDENYRIELTDKEDSKEYFQLLLDGKISELMERFQNNTKE